MGECVRGLVAWLIKTPYFPKNYKIKQLKAVPNLRRLLGTFAIKDKALIGSNELPRSELFLKCFGFLLL